MHSIVISGGNQKKRHGEALKIGELPETSPDLKIIALKEEKRTISISEIRELQKFLNLKPFQEKEKIGIILEAQNLTEEAQNALLKTLEEPPEHSRIILTADNFQKLLPTVISRCEKVKLPPIITLESEASKKIAQDFVTLLEKNIGERLAWVEENKENAKDQGEILKILAIWESTLRNLMLKNLSAEDLNEKIEKIKKIGETRRELTETSVNPRIAFEALLISL